MAHAWFLVCVCMYMGVSVFNSMSVSTSSWGPLGNRLTMTTITSWILCAKSRMPPDGMYHLAYTNLVPSVWAFQASQEETHLGQGQL